MSLRLAKECCGHQMYVVSFVCSSARHALPRISLCVQRRSVGRIKHGSQSMC